MTTKLFRNLFVITLFSATAIIIASCKKKPVEELEKRWITHYQNITLGNPENNQCVGPFFKPKTGEILPLGGTLEIEESIGLIFFSGSHSSYLTFPGNMRDAVYLPENFTVFSDNPNGLKYWPQSKLIAGTMEFVHESDNFGALEFDKVAKSNDAALFDKYFRQANGSSEFLSPNGSSYCITPNAGSVFLIQFSGTVRAMLLVKNCWTDEEFGSITFDIIIESRKGYETLIPAKYLQPDEKEQS